MIVPASSLAVITLPPTAHAPPLGSIHIAWSDSIAGSARPVSTVCHVPFTRSRIMPLRPDAQPWPSGSIATPWTSPMPGGATLATALPTGASRIVPSSASPPTAIARSAVPYTVNSVASMPVSTGWNSPLPSRRSSTPLPPIA